MAGGLVELGQGYKDLSRKMFSDVADREEQRKRANELIKQEEQASTLSLAGTGAAIGSQVYPGWGTLIGGAIGLLGGFAANGNF